MNKTITITPNDWDKTTTTIKIPDGMCWITDASVPIYRGIEHIFIHKTNCPNCGGLLDGDASIPYVYCKCCGAKIWSEREVG